MSQDEAPSAELYARIHDILAEGRHLSGPELESFLARECGDDTALLSRIQELLEKGHDELADAFSESHIRASRVAFESMVDQGSAWMPERIGDFAILRRIGQGGMGVVYEARQDSPSRRVAIKLVHPMQTTPERMRRFRREAEVLGRLQHPGIAQIFEVGTFDAGRGEQPFFAMELIEGVDVRTYCVREHLDLRARIALLASVAEAMHYAHERGVVHRDLKPDNVLVDAQGRPRVLDFGIARVKSQTSTLSTMMTSEGQLVGTLAYMAPEVLREEQGAVTPQVDVYALGVLGYELLVGHAPRQVEGMSLPQAVAALTRGEAPRAGTSDTRLRGDVETILGKALACETRERYASAADLAGDLRRHLADEPILARPPSRTYLLRKFARRNKALVGGVVATLLVSVTGAVVATRLAVHAQAGFELAEKRREQAEVNEARALAGEAEARRRADEVLRLSALQDYDEQLALVDELWPPHPDQCQAYRKWLADTRALVADLPLHRAKREELRERAVPQSDEERERQAWSFPETNAGREARWWHANLTKLIASLEGLQDEATGLLSEGGEARSDGHGWSVPRRLRFAEQLRDGLAPGGAWHDRWAEATAAIAAHPAYGGLELSSQVGLVPIGPDQESGLWEFWHVATGAEPERDAQGELSLTEEMGVVLVLIPGGTFWMGASPDPEAERNYDPHAASEEGPVHEVTLSPYLLSKYEMTQAQWERAAGTDPSYRTPLTRDYIQSRLHPVEQVSWSACRQELERMGLGLPTEAQWEYACRVGSTDPRPFADADFASHANVRDASFSQAFSGSNACEPWEDGFPAHGPVGSLRPNGFGLHDVLGNVWEWCLDGYHPDTYGLGRRVDPFVEGEGANPRVSRGGSFNDSAANTRSAIRHNFTPSFASYSRGVRPARVISE